MMNKKHQFTTAPHWHTHEPDVVLQMLSSPAGDLSQQEAEHRLQELGPNRLRPAKKKGPLVRFLAQLHNVLTLCITGIRRRHHPVRPLGRQQCHHEQCINML